MTSVHYCQTHHSFKTKIVMNKEQIPPPCVLADVGMVLHNLVPQWTSSSPWQNEGAEQYQGHKIWNQSE